jgi:hypothetical protein
VVVQHHVRGADQAGAATIRGWTVTWTFANGQQVSQV